MKKRTLWILLTVLFAASALYAVTSVAKDGLRDSSAALFSLSRSA